MMEFIQQLPIYGVGLLAGLLLGEVYKLRNRVNKQDKELTQVNEFHCKQGLKIADVIDKLNARVDMLAARVKATEHNIINMKVTSETKRPS